MKRLYTVVDLETTGSNNGNHPIEIALINLTFDQGEFQLEEEYCWKIKPPVESLEEEIEALTGIKYQDLANAPEFNEVAQEILDITDGRTFVAHDTRYDYTTLKREFANLGMEFERKYLCTLRTTKREFPCLGAYDLKSLCDFFSIDLKEAHRALPDAKATAQLLQKVLPDYRLKFETSTEREQQAQELVKDVPNGLGVGFIYGGESVFFVNWSSQLQSALKKKIIELLSMGVTPDRVDFREANCRLIAEIKYEQYLHQLRPKLNRNSILSNRFALYKEVRKGRVLFKAGRIRKGQHILRTYAREADAIKDLKGILKRLKKPKVIGRDPKDKGKGENAKYQRQLNDILKNYDYPHENFMIKGPSDDGMVSVLTFRKGRFERMGAVSEDCFFQDGDWEGILKPQRETPQLKDIILNHLRVNRTNGEKDYTIREIKKVQVLDADSYIAY